MRLLNIIQAGCKVNLFLHIKEQRPDGLHNLESVFLPLKKPFDTLEILLSDGPDGDFQVNVLPGKFPMDPANNTLTKAYTGYAEATGFAPPLYVVLRKGIPMGAGLGGGSSDAASLLRHLQTLASQCGQTPLDEAELARLAAHIGADVPFFLTDRPAYARGIGEVLTPARNPFEGMFLLLACPRVKVSTSWAYKTLAEARALLSENLYSNDSELFSFFAGENANQVLTSMPDRDTTHFVLPHGLGNSFEEVIFRAFPELGRIKNSMLDNGAVHALMSGSGSSIFGIFRTRAAAKHMENVLKPFNGRTYLLKV